jgi:sugar phosphate isomerase/epimerase
MKLVTNTCALTEKLQFGESLELIARAGFDGVDCSFFDMKGDDSVWNGPGWREFAKEMRIRAEDLSLVFRQAHAPFPSARENEDYNKMIFPRILRSMEAAAILGVENIVVHPVHYGPYWENREEQYRRSLDFYRELIPYCKEFGIRVCTENMWSRDKARTIRDSLLSRPEEFCAFVDELNSPYIGACLDLGHAALVGQEPANMIKRMGTRLTCLHVHDVDYLDDKHTLPFTQSLDWEEIAKALGEVGYRGDFTYEANVFLKKLPQDLWTEGLKMMAAVGRYLIARIEENYKEQ